MKVDSDGQTGLSGVWTGVLAPGRDIGAAMVRVCVVMPQWHGDRARASRVPQ